MRRVFPPFVSGLGSVGLLVLRVVTGLAFVMHGWGKIQNPFHWMDQMPDAPPGVLQGLAAVAEFGGGIALIIGFLTPAAAFLIACTMAVALAKIHLPAGDPFVSSVPHQASYELAAGYLAQMIMFLLVGPGTLSVDACLFGKKKIGAP
ncbi:MAG TPA: DoxX family protein [Gemmataceae bacterium]|nr:DoxX family protein [Gemmataceae bacterium]